MNIYSPMPYSMFEPEGAKDVSYETLIGRVERGMDLLDNVLPGWDDSININTLNIRSEIDCVLGQIFTDYHIGLSYLDLDLSGSRDYGFTVDFMCAGVFKTFDNLTKIWKEKMMERKMNKEFANIGEAVARGAELLDNEYPGWDKKVDLGRLSMSSHADCVLGQVYGSVGVGHTMLNNVSLSEHGFVIAAELNRDYANRDTYWDELESCWKNEIIGRELMEIASTTEAALTS